MARRPLSGVETFTLNGEVWNLTKSSWRPSNPKREILKGQTAVEGYSETPMQGSIEVTVRAQPGQDTSALANTTNGTGVLKQRNGTTVYGSGLVQTAEGKTETAEGTVDLVFEGPTVTAQVAA